MNKKPKQTCYQILGVPANASDEEVRQAYYLMALHFHPDRHPGDIEANQLFLAANHAYNMLKTKPQRKAYNRYLAQQMCEVANRKSSPACTRRKPHWILHLLLILKEIFWPFAFSKVRQEA